EPTGEAAPGEAEERPVSLTDRPVRAYAGASEHVERALVGGPVEVLRQVHSPRRRDHRRSRAGCSLADVSNDLVNEPGRRLRDRQELLDEVERARAMDRARQCDM